MIAIPATLAPLLTRLGDLARESNVGLFVVGGAVRDLILNRAITDLDLMVEGDAIAFARRVSSRYGGGVLAHPPFGTATWTLSAPAQHEPRQIDFATARTETYAAPAALPVVTPGTLQEDLRRRDFSINALALQLAPTFGVLLDQFEGQQDLAAGRIRVLHAGSFIDDPTRIFRAARYEQRFHFQLDPQTEALIAPALPYLRQLSGERLRHEFDMILAEAAPERSLSRLQQWGVLQQSVTPQAGLATGLTLDQWAAQAMAALRTLVQNHPAQIDWIPSKHRLESSYWAILCASALFARDDLTVPSATERPTAAALHAIATRLSLSRAILATVEGVLHVDFAQLSSAAQPSTIDAILYGLTTEALGALWALADSDLVRERLERFACEWRYVTPLLDGAALQALGLIPGKQFGVILRQLRIARLDGLVRDEADERALVQQLLQQLREESGKASGV